MRHVGCPRSRAEPAPSRDRTEASCPRIQVAVARTLHGRAEELMTVTAPGQACSSVQPSELLLKRPPGRGSSAMAAMRGLSDDPAHLSRPPPVSPARWGGGTIGRILADQMETTGAEPTNDEPPGRARVPPHITERRWRQRVDRRSARRGPRLVRPPGAGAASRPRAAPSPTGGTSAGAGALAAPSDHCVRRSSAPCAAHAGADAESATSAPLVA